MAMIGDRGFRPAPHAVFVTATVLFVLARTLNDAPMPGTHLMSVLDPGFSAGFLTLDLGG